MPFVCGYMARMATDNELKMTKNGKEICSFTVANEEGWGDRKRLDYIRCTAFGTTAKTIVNHFPKGTPIIIEGQWNNNPFRKDEKGYDIQNWTFIVNKVIFILKSKNDSTNKNEYVPYSSIMMGTPQDDSSESNNDDMEFAPTNVSTEDLPF